MASGATSTLGGTASQENRSDYFIDLLFRDDRPAAVSEDAAHATATRILVHNLANGQLSVEDRTYLAQLVAQRTNLSRVQAEQRVDQAYAQARQAIDTARQVADQAAKAAAWSTLWMFIALLIGAFFASLAATFGGRQRDGVVYLKAPITRLAPRPCTDPRRMKMRSLLLFFLGVPIPVIILIALFVH